MPNNNDPDQEVVRYDTGGWISGPCLDPDQLPDATDEVLTGQLADQTGWTIWRGNVTGEYWASPPRNKIELGLVSASSLALLRTVIETKEEQATRGEPT